MKDTTVIIVSTIGFILVLLNDIYLVLTGITIGVLIVIFLLLTKNTNIITKVSTVILSTLTVILGFLWMLHKIFKLF